MIKPSSCSQEEYIALVQIHNSLHIVWPEAPRSAKAWEQQDQRRDPKSINQRWLAVEDGAVVGFASYSHSAWDNNPQRFSINIEVHPAFQNRGIGAALYDQIMQGLLPHQPQILRADAFTNLPQGFTFLQKRGFYEAFRETPVHLELAALDLSPFAGLEPNLSSQGIFIRTARELECDPNRDQKIYNLYWEVSEDVPHEDETVEKPSFEEWQRWGLNPAATLLDAYFIATYGDRYIGLREMYEYGDHTALLGSLLGVRREYRGRGIGLALHLRGIQYAKDHGYPQVKTCTAVQNAPMQALFNKLGYTRDPEWLQCQKDIA